jgi:hypothetical protein
MNLSYNTQLPFQPPVSDRSPALKGLASAPRHPQYGSNYGDLTRAYAVENMGAYNRAADQASFNYDVARTGAQQGLALGGLRNMAEEQQRQRDLTSARLQNMRTALGALL